MKIRQVRSSLNETTHFKFTVKIETILIEYLDYLEDYQCGRVS